MFFRASHLVAAMALFEGSSAKDWLSPEYKYFYQFPLPIPPVKQPKMSITNPVTNKQIDYYEVDIVPFKQQVYPNKGPASLVGYDGISPGPTFLVPRGRETVVRFTNKAVLPSAVHLHGSPSRAPWDGWAEDRILPGQYKDYYYPNSQSGRFLWYHDHAMDITAVNAYFGQAGAYIIQDPAEDALGLPTGYGVNDIPLVLSSKQYNNDGSLFSPAGETDSLWGDVIQVNGQPWPFFKVEPRKYRLRFLNSAVSRSFILYFQRQTGGANIPFQVIASDAGLLTGPITSSTLTISMAERWEVVFDFSQFAGQNITLRNQDDVGKDKDYGFTNQVMRFVVSKPAVVDNAVVPANLRNVPFPPSQGNGVDRKFLFHRQGGGWKINGVGFSDVKNRILANVPRGKVEIWEFENGGGGWTHPIHVHLVDFRVLSRTKAKRPVLPYEAAGLKDVVWLDAGEVVRVEAHYAPWDGVYMFHCHNLIHEDHEMMAAFNVTALADFGYNETSFADPMEARWRAVPVTATAFSADAITQKVQFMASLHPYNNVDEVTTRLNQYWSTRGGVKMRRVKRAAQAAIDGPQ
ncbi:bilirubin oxidase [Colletotrichum scovillei]|uniref:Bilirubin oxidase n=1 Tax=Colletotrichum scovillei TaxID=1209932 RepID=A0A9P7R3V4_9PEZI|nr:bilirubin oxidase [Colletotrichum scovillei]KAG7065379.1 bilirubin oxidase [Colletotrichum scovillei]KAG7067981.1 bilirubin oxidase [Colletotrichum scovillei]